MAQYVGIDVYHGTNVVDFSLVKPAVDFMMLKIGQGTSFTDPEFSNYSSECERLGIPYGGYWFVDATTVAQAENEADRCLALLQGKNPKFPIAFDYEPQTPQTPQISCAMCRAFLNKILQAGYFPMLYTNKNYYLNLFNDVVQNEVNNGTYELWIARYFGTNASTGLNYPILPDRENPDDLQTHFQNLGIWQWGYWNFFPGVRNVHNNRVDANIGYKNYGQLIPPRPPFPRYHKMPLWMMLRHN